MFEDQPVSIILAEYSIFSKGNTYLKGAVEILKIIIKIIFDIFSLSKSTLGVIHMHGAATLHVL